MGIIRRIFDYKGTPILVTGFALLFWADCSYQMRKRKQPRLVRAVNNAIVAIPAFTLLRFMFLPAMVYLAKQNEKKNWGIIHWFNAPPLVKQAIAFLIMDYTNYLWHVLNHKIPLLWRFHLVHHSDPDLDLSTAIRFHFGEMIGSLFYRGAFVLLSGASPSNVLYYEIVFEGATQFHHTNMKLPYRLEKIMSNVIVTPRMHGIHHSQVRHETDSNYSVIFSWWDRLHKTIRLNVLQDKIVTGVPAYSHIEELTVGFLWKLPFMKIREWKQDVGEENRTVGEIHQLAQ
ncbi:sterol desaturase family protein [Aridibaculum aurantiacum]|uniref:sterol desaturase family protein n=1 Tax=Aridibaculum aurantiacum TaxID=2810307 RepID=UPI001A96CDAE|nr:sterol desaturase family protein [Aridibaculum aurantiacum]